MPDLMSLQDCPEGPGTYMVVLLVSHPDMDAAEIGRYIGAQPHDTFTTSIIANSWSRFYHFRRDCRVGEALERIVVFLEDRKASISKLRLRGATIILHTNLPGDANVGGTLPWELLRRLSELRISLSFEVYPAYDALGFASHMWGSLFSP